MEAKNKTIGYIRVSTEHQSLDHQRHLLYDYAFKNKITIDEIMEVGASSWKSPEHRKLDILFEKLKAGDHLLTPEVTRLGRTMIETINNINHLWEKGIVLISISQPELSTNSPWAKLILAILSYFGEAERERISIRTKQGLAARKTTGIVLGRRAGCKNMKTKLLTPYRDEIINGLNLKLPIASIVKILNTKLERPIKYTALLYYLKHDKELLKVQKQARRKLLI